MTTIKKLAKDAGIADDDIDRFEAAMSSVKDVLDGKVKPPGGAMCRFPHCRCNMPWEKCEQKYS